MSSTRLDSFSERSTVKKTRLAIVLSHPVQYYAPWFAQISRLPSIALRVFYLFNPDDKQQNDPGFGHAVSWDVDLLSGYDHEFVPNTAAHPSPNAFKGLRNPGLPARLDAFDADAVLLFGYAFTTHAGLILRRKLRRLRPPLLFRGDSHLLGGPPPRRLKTWLLRFVFSGVDAVLAVGKSNAAYFRYFGVPSQKLFFAPHAVDTPHFTATNERCASALHQRKEMGIDPEDHVILFAGKFTAKKRPDMLLSAFVQAAPQRTHLVLAGNGHLEPSLRATAGDHPRVHFLPFANQQLMPTRYLLGDVFALPSAGRYETWGLAVNEAMHLGRPAIVSDVVGCQTDLVTNKDTGWVFPASDLEALRNIVGEIDGMSKSELVALGQNARSRAAAYNYENATTGLLSALKFVSTV